VNRILLALTSAISIALGILLWRATRPEPRPLERFSVEIGPDASRGARTTAVLSPDGTRIAYIAGTATTQLATRRLDQANSVVLAGTDGASDPFFSPDGQWIGFFADGRMKKVTVQGGAPLSLCDASNPRGAWWGDDGWIAASLDGIGLWRVPAAGGAPQPLEDISRSGDQSHRWPQILPGGEAVLFTASDAAGGGSSFENAHISVLSLKTGKLHVVVRGGYFGRYLPDGRIAYIHQGSLYTARFDRGKMELRGTPVAVLKDVAGNATQGCAQLSFTRDGTLAYLSGASSGDQHQLVWLDAGGEQEPVLGPFNLSTPRISPDGKRIAMSLAGTLAVYDERRDVLARLYSGNLNYPVWTPDGRDLLASVAQATVSWLPSDGTAPPRTLYQAKEGLAFPTSISPDGKLAAFQTSGGVWLLSLELEGDQIRAGEPRQFLAAPAADAAFSPDGHWLAYASNDSGKDQVFAVPFPQGLAGGRVLISGTPGRFPMWSRTRKEIFYVSEDGILTAVPYEFERGILTPGKVSAWHSTPVFQNGRLPTVDLAPDGKRFLITAPGANPGDDPGPVHMTIILHFF
jgi:serine/threonine-protein kinase